VKALKETCKRYIPQAQAYIIVTTQIANAFPDNYVFIHLFQLKGTQYMFKFIGNNASTLNKIVIGESYGVASINFYPTVTVITDEIEVFKHTKDVITVKLFNFSLILILNI
jgi:hypothetical protein